LWRNAVVHRAAWQALERTAMAAISFCAITLLVFIAFYALPSRSSLPRRGPAQPGVHATAHGYLTYVWNIVRHGDLGNSFYSREAVTAHVMRAVPVTLSLVAGGLVVALLLSLYPFLRPPRVADKTSSLLAMAGISLHPVWISLLAAWFFGAYLSVLPIGGYCGLTSLGTGCDGVSHWASHLLLPWLVFGVLNGAYYALAVRSLVATELEQEYIVQARAVGMSEPRIMRSHVLRNIASPLLALVVTNLGIAFSSVIFIESVFGLPGIGNMFRRSLLQHDLPVTAGIVLTVTVTILVLGLLADLASVALRPKPRPS
jgi:peptide/nickel transport system permease protein